MFCWLHLISVWYLDWHFHWILERLEILSNFGHLYVIIRHLFILFYTGITIADLIFLYNKSKVSNSILCTHCILIIQNLGAYIFVKNKYNCVELIVALINLCKVWCIVHIFFFNFCVTYYFKCVIYWINPDLPLMHINPVFKVSRKIFYFAIFLT